MSYGVLHILVLFGFVSWTCALVCVNLNHCITQQKPDAGGNTDDYMYLILICCDVPLKSHN